MNVSLPDFATAGQKSRPDVEWSEAQSVESGSLDLRRIFGLLRRQSRLIVLTVLVILAGTAAVVFSLTPSYKASALLLVDPTRKDLLATEAQVGSAQADSARVDSEVEIMRSNAVLMDVVASQQLISDPEFGVRLGLRDRIAIALRLKKEEPITAEQSLGAVMGNLRRAVSVQRRALTYVVSVDVDSVSAGKAAAIANALADVYIQRQVQSKVDATLVRRDAIRDQIEVARRAVVAAENQYSEFVSSNLDRLVSATGQTDLRAMRDSLQRLTNEQQNASREMETLQRGLEQRNSTELADQLQSQAAQELSRQRRTILASLGQPGTSGERAVNLQQELSRVDTTLAEEARKRVNELQTTVNSNQTQVSQMRANLNSALLRADLPTDVQARVYELLQVSSNATTSYQTLLSRLQDMETQASLQVADSRVVSPALVPNSPSFPRTSLIFPAAAFFALGVGVTLAFLFDNFIGGFTSAAQVQAVTGRRLASVVPLQKKDPNQKSVADNVLTRPISRYSESVRRLRAAIDRSYLQGDYRKERESERAVLVMLTSALPGEGKTTLSLSLARSLAQEGKRVLLIDCDLRRPSVHKQLGVTPTAGLPDLLNGKLTRDELQNVMVKDPSANLHVILGKREAETPADQLLNRTTFAQLIEAVARLFDYVILDSPPIEPVVDGLYIAEHVDVIGFVVHAAKTPQSVVMSALKSIHEAKPQGVETLIALNHEVEDRLTGYRTYGRYYTD